MYRHRSYGGWECIGTYSNLQEAAVALEEYKRSSLGETGKLKLYTDDIEALLDSGELDKKQKKGLE